MTSKTNDLTAVYLNDDDVNFFLRLKKSKKGVSGNDADDESEGGKTNEHQSSTTNHRVSSITCGTDLEKKELCPG